MPTTDPLARTELTFLLGLGFQVVLAEFLARVDATGQYADLRPVHGAFFQALGPHGATGVEVAQRLGMTKQAAGQIADELERKGYVRRDAHPAGGRRRLITLTEKGHAHMRTAGSVMHRLEAEIGGRIGDEALADLRGTLARIIRDLVGDDVPALRPQW